MADNFNDGTIAPDVWQPSLTGTGTTVSEQNRRLELTFAADATAEPNNQGFSMMAAQVGTACRFLGNFDVSVSYELLDWPETNGVMVQLAAWFHSSNAAVVRQSPRTGLETYAAWRGSAGKTVATLDRQGGLRLRRSGSELAAYAQRTGSPWVRLSTFRAPPGTQAPAFGLQAMSTDEWFADQPIKIAFDDFEIKAAQRVC